MKLLWHGEWIDTPGYLAGCGTLVDVEMALPLWRLEDASGRPTRNPRRKVAVFLVTDGPRSTWRKAQTKRREPRFTGDFRVAVIVGRRVSDDARVVGLGSRVPPGAQQVALHPRLVNEIGASFSRQDLADVASALLEDAEALRPLARQSYLHSTMDPPVDLVKKWDHARRPRQGNAPLSRPINLIIPPRSTGDSTATLLRLSPPQPPGATAVALLGAGDYARTEIIPALRTAGFTCHSVADRDPQIAALVGREYGFEVATTDSERAIAELPPGGLVVVATAHDSHAHLATLAAAAGHRVFLEKPPTVTASDAAELAKAMREHPGMVEIGFNRRYHPLVRRARARLAAEQGPTSITCTVKELAFQPDHWYFWANQGTRFTGNLCHWIDLAVFLIEGNPLPVSLTVSPRVARATTDDEERVLTVTFDDGSLLTVLGTSRGDDIRGVQEHIDIRRGRTSMALDDLWKCRSRSGGVERYSRTVFRNKAHGRMYREAFGRIRRGEDAIYPAGDMLVVSAIQITASDLVGGDERQAEIPAWLGPALDLVTAR